MSDSKTLSAGQETDYTYDGKSRLIFSSTLDFYLGKTLDRTLEYKQSGLPITETLSYADSFAVVRHFAYNRRGQRTMVVDTVRLKSTGQILPEGVDSSVYVYDSLTSLLTTVSATVDSSGTKCNYARVHYLYDNAGRETRDTVKAANCSGGAAGSTVTDLTYDDRGRVSQKTVSVNGATVYSYGALTYKHGGGADELIGYTGVIPTEPFSLGQGLDYDTAGTRRLIQSSGRDGVAQSYRYDTFGNRVSQWSSGGCAYHDTLTYDPASNAIQTRVNTGCTRNTTFYTDHAGSRLAEQDNTSGGANTNRMSYTAGGQLYFSYVWSGVNLPKRYNYTWNWYDGEGRRIIAHSRNGTGDVTAATAPDSGIRTFYVYDGSDVALAIVNGSPGTWAIRQRYLNGGLDHQLAMRTRQGATGYPKTLALISDYQGSLIGAFNTSGVIDPQVVNFKADPFGTVTQAFDQYDGPVNPEVGYTGAATTNSTAGFVYLRNRWYDPQTGRFLTQDPIGLAGGVNLYAYAGNNPIAYSDPFGLGPNCNATTGLAMAICVAATALEGIVKNVESHGLGPSMDQLSPEMAPEGSASTAIANGVKTGGRFETFYGTTGAMQPPNPTRGAAPSRIGDQGTGRLPVPGIRGGVLGAIVLLLIPDLQTQPAVICLKEGCGPQDPPPTIGPQPNR
jgi:RHS repeat-associated protein